MTMNIPHTIGIDMTKFAAHVEHLQKEEVLYSQLHGANALKNVLSTHRQTFFSLGHKKSDAAMMQLTTKY